MSYLDSPRLHFAGWFQADVSTINNDVRFYQNASFVPAYQQLNQNGSWNPEGTGVFRFVDCAVTGAVRNGQPVTADPLLGYTLQNASHRAPGKLVDLDPQQQMVSQIWGLQVRLLNVNSDSCFEGDFAPVAFVNLWQRQQTGVRRDQLLSACYQSVLEHVEWGDVSDSPLLTALKATSAKGMLSIQFNVYGYGRDSTIPRYTMGHVAGTIGPYLSGEPKHFVLGRQLIASGSNFTQPDGGLGSLQGLQIENVLTLDFGNTFPIESANSGLKDLGEIQLGVLSTSPGAILSTVPPEQFVLIGPVPYQTPNWYQTTAGVQSFDLSANPRALQLVANHPLVLVAPSGGTGNLRVLLQESVGGLYVRADNFVYRLNAGDRQPLEFYASSFGTPLAGAVVNLGSTQGLMGGSGGGPTISPAPTPPAAIPNVGTPADGISYAASVTTNDRGYASTPICANPNGPGTPRGYIAHQLYGIGYQLASQPAGYAANPLNYVSILAFTKKVPPTAPTWYADIQPLFTQYGNLYPIMGRYVVDLADYGSVVSRRRILTLVFSLPPEDPNHMPVTRDLSEGDRATILNWLSAAGPDGLPPLGEPAESTSPAPATEVESAPLTPLLPEQAAGKTAVILQYESRRNACRVAGNDTH